MRAADLFLKQAKDIDTKLPWIIHKVDAQEVPLEDQLALMEEKSTRMLKILAWRSRKTYQNEKMEELQSKIDSTKMAIENLEKIVEKSANPEVAELEDDDDGIALDYDRFYSCVMADFEEDFDE